jgi:hypothetical protein
VVINFLRPRRPSYFKRDQILPKNNECSPRSCAYIKHLKSYSCHAKLAQVANTLQMSIICLRLITNSWTFASVLQNIPRNLAFDTESAFEFLLNKSLLPPSSFENQHSFHTIDSVCVCVCVCIPTRNQPKHEINSVFVIPSELGYRSSLHIQIMSIMFWSTVCLSRCEFWLRL